MPNSSLSVPREKAEEVVNRHLHEGQQLAELGAEIDTEGRLQEWQQNRERWVNLTEAGLAKVADDDIAQEFGRSATPAMVIGSGEWEDFGRERQAIDRGTNSLVSILERFEYMDAPVSEKASERVETQDLAHAEVFLVHGQNEEIRSQVVDFLHRTGDHPVRVLHELANEGRTLIEKFENYAGDVGYAVVLLTGDDRGGSVQNEESRPRARQNVLFELGFFFGAIGRRHVAVLFEDGVELPSDVDGIVYIPLDSTGKWQRILLRELRAVGLTYSLDGLL